jgi:hypothetical protein
MSDLDDKIEEIKVKIYDLQKDLAVIMNDAAKPKKWSPVGGDWFIDDEGLIFHHPSSRDIKEFGHERQTEKQAICAVLEMRRFNRLLALRDELCGDDANWLAGKNNYWVYYDYEEDNYGFCSNSIMQTIGLVYFSTEASVQRACEMLNSGEVEL